MDKESSGLSIEDAQHAICNGTYGGKEWSASEKQAACDRYEQPTGSKLESGARHLELWAMPVVSIVFLVIGAAIIICRLKTRKKTKKRR